MERKDLKNHLKMMDSNATPRDAEDFWAEFRQRIKSEEREIAPPSVLLFPRILKLAALIAVVAIISMLYLSRVDTPPAIQSTKETVTNASVQSLVVKNCHTATFITDDQEHHGTIVWIAGLELDTEVENCL